MSELNTIAGQLNGSSDISIDPAEMAPGTLQQLTEAERIFIAQQRKSAEMDRAFNAGLEAAARLAESWADQCCGGSGEGGEGYRNLAKSILAAQR